MPRGARPARPTRKHSGHVVDALVELPHLHEAAPDARKIVEHARTVQALGHFLVLTVDETTTSSEIQFHAVPMNDGA